MKTNPYERPFVRWILQLSEVSILSAIFAISSQGVGFSVWVQNYPYAILIAAWMLCCLPLVEPNVQAFLNKTRSNKLSLRGISGVFAWQAGTIGLVTLLYILAIFFGVSINTGRQSSPLVQVLWTMYVAASLSLLFPAFEIAWMSVRYAHSRFYPQEEQ